MTDLSQIVMAGEDPLRVQQPTAVPDQHMERKDSLLLHAPSLAQVQAAERLEVQVVQEHQDSQDHARSTSLPDLKEVAAETLEVQVVQGPQDSQDQARSTSLPGLKEVAVDGDDGESIAGVEKMAPSVCLALIAATTARTTNTELQLRLVHLSKQHRHSNFTQRYVVLNGRQADPSMVDMARFLQQEHYIDEWVISNYSSEYMVSVNSTANWGGSFKVSGLSSKFGSIAHGSLDTDAPDIELERYYAIDQCNADYIALVNSDAVMFSEPGYSWIEQGIRALQLNADLTLIIPPFPGMSKRRVRSRPSTQPILKPNRGHFAEGVQLIDTTCEHPFSLPGTAALLDIQRYKQVGPRSQIMEHRCAGVLVHNKPCGALPYVRKCGGIRTWEASLECVICNSPKLRQAHLADEQLCWLWYAPLSNLRFDMGGLRDLVSRW